MAWTRSETLALAQQSCAFCHGLGLRPGRRGVSTPCNCVFRAIFRACFEKFRYCVSKEKRFSRVSLEIHPGRQRHSTWGLKNEEFIADFCLVSRRNLTPMEHRIFRYHYMLGADWKLCCPKFAMERGEFFHYLYRIEQKLGRIFRELKPHSLFPVDEYFNGPSKYEKPLLEILESFPVQEEKEEEEEEHEKKPVVGPVLLKFPIKHAA